MKNNYKKGSKKIKKDDKKPPKTKKSRYNK